MSEGTALRDQRDVLGPNPVLLTRDLKQARRVVPAQESASVRADVSPAPLSGASGSVTPHEVETMMSANTAVAAIQRP